MPDDVTVEWKRDEKDKPLFTFISATEKRSLEFLSKAVKWKSYDGSIKSPRYDDPRYGIISF